MKPWKSISYVGVQYFQIVMTNYNFMGEEAASSRPSCWLRVATDCCVVAGRHAASANHNSDVYTLKQGNTECVSNIDFTHRSVVSNRWAHEASACKTWHSLSLWKPKILAQICSHFQQLNYYEIVVLHDLVACQKYLCCFNASGMPCIVSKILMPLYEYWCYDALNDVANTQNCLICHGHTEQREYSTAIKTGLSVLCVLRHIKILVRCDQFPRYSSQPLSIGIVLMAALETL